MYFDLFDEDTEGARPDRLVGVRPQERDQRRTVEQIVDSPPVVPSLDVPVPQRENQLVEACRHLDLPIPEQAIEVPKISSTPRSSPQASSLCGADGRTVGGSADDHILCFVTWDYGAERGHSSSS